MWYSNFCSIEFKIEALDKPARLIVRANRIIITSDKLKVLLDKKYGIKTSKIPHYKDALIFIRFKKATISCFNIARICYTGPQNSTDNISNIQSEFLI